MTFPLFRATSWKDFPWESRRSEKSVHAAFFSPVLETKFQNLLSQIKKKHKSRLFNLFFTRTPRKKN